MTGEPLREERYRIKDCYTRFYLHYVEPRKQAIERGLYDFSSIEQLHGLDGMLGYQFEALVYDGDLSKTVTADRYFDFVIPSEALFRP